MRRAGGRLATKSRNNRGSKTGEDSAPGTPPIGPERHLPRWNWRAFPVFAGFSLGLLVSFLVDGGSHNPAGFFVQLAALLGVGYSLAHIVVTNVVLAGRVRRLDAARERGEAPGEETEEIVVYPAEAPPDRRG